MTESSNEPESIRRNARCLAIRRHAQRRHFNFYSRSSTSWTFVQNVAAAPISWRAEHWVLAGVVLMLTALVGIVIPSWASATRTDPAPTAYTTMALELPELAPGSEADPTIGAYGIGDADAGWVHVTVRAGQSLADIFRENDLSPRDLQRALDSQDDASALRSIHPGDEFSFLRAGDGTLTAMRFDRGDAARVTLHFTPDKITESVDERAVERRLHVAHGVLTRSLYQAGEQAGMSDTMIWKLATAFGYDIDFAQDLREGDSFSVIYDDIYRDGERLHDGDIIAATFINQGKRYTAIRYTNAKGDTLFYSEDGRPLRKAFLRTPVEFTRISSVFSVARMHPILGYMRAHKGVDYAAPIGTPIRAAGDGKIVFRGWKSGYGNFVVIQHNAHISTAYGHMSRFAHEKIGQHVSQGQVIGYVGMTGLATGPHLHYEFRVDGQHRDPLKVTLPKEEPLPPTQLAEFRLKAAPLLAKLKFVSGTQLARSDD